MIILIENGIPILENNGSNNLIPFNRKIFYCVDKTLKDREISILREIENLLKIENNFPEFWEASDTLRFIYEYRWESSVVFDRIREHFFWLQNLEKKRMSYEAKSLLDCGIVYQIGRDKHYRPNIFIDLSKVKELKGKFKLQKISIEKIKS